MKVVVDLEICRGHGRCYEICPEVYGEDDEGHCVIEETEVPDRSKEAARRAANNCPERAISIIDGG
ncbi:MAG: ferredoxin [Deltaproteobacteria bacterium]|jgi:ferredoxin|nr:ferredoxin [Deltaproteobacteria bacterium]MBW2500294.1 ferredoxin [Deltaproteobacteria bacterium]